MDLASERPRHFASDNYAGICSEAWQAMAEANSGLASSYGDDRWTAQACEKIREVFEGRQGPERDIVLANAAAALWTAGRSESLTECAGLAAAAIDRGSAATLLRQLVVQTT